METLSFHSILSVLSEFGLVGLVLFIYWLDTKKLAQQHESHRSEVSRILEQYRQDMAELRRMYESNVRLVEAYEGVAKDLREVVIMNTQVITRMEEAIRDNQYCPMVRLEKKAQGVQSRHERATEVPGTAS